MQTWIYYLIVFLIPYSVSGFCKMQDTSENKAMPSKYVYKTILDALVKYCSVSQ